MQIKSKRGTFIISKTDNLYDDHKLCEQFKVISKFKYSLEEAFPYKDIFDYDSVYRVYCTWSEADEFLMDELTRVEYTDIIFNNIFTRGLRILNIWKKNIL